MLRWGGRAPCGGDGRAAPPLRIRAGPGARRPGCPRGSWHASLTALSSRRPSRSASSVLPSALPGLPSSPPLPGQPVCLLGQPPCLPFPCRARPELPAAGQEERGGAEEAPPWACSTESLGSGNAGHLGMPGPRSVPGAPLGKMKQQPLLLARVKCDRKIGEAAGGGGRRPAGLCRERGPLAAWLPPPSPTPHRHHQAPGADVPGSRGEVVIPTQPLPERARTGPGGIAQTQFSVILRAERRRQHGAVRAGCPEEAAVPGLQSGQWGAAVCPVEQGRRLIRARHPATEGNLGTPR